MVSTRRTRSHSLLSNQDAVAEAVTTQDSPRKTRSGRTRAKLPVRVAQTHCDQVVTVSRPETKKSAPKKRGRPPKKGVQKQADLFDDNTSELKSSKPATPVRTPLSEVSYTDARAASGAASPRKSVHNSQTPVKSPAKCDKTTPRIHVYESPTNFSSMRSPAQISEVVQVRLVSTPASSPQPVENESKPHMGQEDPQSDQSGECGVLPMLGSVEEDPERVGELCQEVCSHESNLVSEQIDMDNTIGCLPEELEVEGLHVLFDKSPIVSPVTIHETSREGTSFVMPNDEQASTSHDSDMIVVQDLGKPDPVEWAVATHSKSAHEMVLLSPKVDECQVNTDISQTEVLASPNTQIPIPTTPITSPRVSADLTLPLVLQEAPTAPFEADSIESDANCRSPSNISHTKTPSPSSIRFSPAGNEADLPEETLQPSTPIQWSMPRQPLHAPSPPLTTWIDGVEVTLPPDDDWSSIYSHDSSRSDTAQEETVLGVPNVTLLASPHLSAIEDHHMDDVTFISCFEIGPTDSRLDEVLDVEARTKDCRKEESVPTQLSAISDSFFCSASELVDTPIQDLLVSNPQLLSIVPVADLDLLEHVIHSEEEKEESSSDPTYGQSGTTFSPCPPPSVPYLEDDSLVEAIEQDLERPNVSLIDDNEVAILANIDSNEQSVPEEAFPDLRDSLVIDQLSDQISVAQDSIDEATLSRDNSTEALTPDQLNHVDEAERLEVRVTCSPTPKASDQDAEHDNPCNAGSDVATGLDLGMPAPTSPTAINSPTEGPYQSLPSCASQSSIRDSLGSNGELSFIVCETDMGLTSQSDGCTTEISGPLTTANIEFSEELSATQRPMSPDKRDETASRQIGCPLLCPNLELKNIDQASFSRSESPDRAVKQLKSPVSGMESADCNDKERSSSRRQSRRQSYMTATKTAVREREMEMQQKQESQEEEDLQLAAELDLAESILQHMPGSVERRRSKQGDHFSTRRRSSISIPSVRLTRSRASIEAESFSPIRPHYSLLEDSSLGNAATKIQAVFRGWQQRRQISRIRASSKFENKSSSERSDPELTQVRTYSLDKQESPRPKKDDTDIDNVFSAFLSEWQSKKSRQAKVEDVGDSTSPKKSAPETPKRALAGAISPVKSARKAIVTTVPSSTSKSSAQYTAGIRTGRSRLPAPRSGLTAEDGNFLPMRPASEDKANSSRIARTNGNKSVQSSSSPKMEASRPLLPVDKKRKSVEEDSNIRKRLRLQQTSKPSSSGIPVSGVASANRTKVTSVVTKPKLSAPVTPKRLMYLTPAEVTKTTRGFTSQNRIYRCDFDRIVVRKEIPRPPSPTAKLQAKMASNARTKRRRLMKEKGYTFGAGDDADYCPKIVSPERKTVKWGEALEVDLSSLPRTSPSKVRSIEAVLPCIAPVPLDDYGNVEDNTPLTPQLGKAPKVVITKYLYRGEQDD